MFPVGVGGGGSHENPHALEVRATTQPNLVQQIPGMNQRPTLPTPARVNLTSVHLEGYGQKQRYYLINGFVNGFPLGTVGVVPGEFPFGHKTIILFLHCTQNLSKPSWIKN